MNRTDPFAPARPLPRPIRPLASEDIASYIHRLARANALTPADLLGIIAGPSRKTARIRVHDLATLTALSTDVLLRALPNLTAQPETPRRHRPNSETRVHIGQRRYACRRCVARRAPGDDLAVCQITTDQSICPHHRLWIGEGVEHPAHQLHIAALPEILRAHRYHQRLVHQHGREETAVDYAAARQTITAWDRNTRCHHDLNTHRQQALRTANPHLERDAGIYNAATYPQVVTLTSLLLSPLGRPLLRHDRRDLPTFIDEVTRRGIGPYKLGLTRIPNDPITLLCYGPQLRHATQ